MLISPLAISRIGVHGFGYWVLATQIPSIVVSPGLSWLCLVRTLGEGVEDLLGLVRGAWLGCDVLVADHDGCGA